MTLKPCKDTPSCQRKIFKIRKLKTKPKCFIFLRRKDCDYTVHSVHFCFETNNYDQDNKIRLLAARARGYGALVQDWEEPCHYRISLFRLMGCFKMFDNSMFLHRKWARSLRCLLWISCPSAGWLSLTSGRRSQRWKSTETRNAARKVTAESSLTIRLNSSLLPRTAHTGRGCFPSRCLLVFSNPNKIQLLFNYCSTRYSRK